MVESGWKDDILMREGGLRDILLEGRAGQRDNDGTY
jgi:hypothetical protein